jgi:hypothetical protein
MADLRDYLKLRGDLTFEERPFNDCDNIVLATLSYVDLTGIVPKAGSGTTVRLSDAVGALLDSTGDDVSGKIRSLAAIDADFLRLLASSVRFGGAELGEYVDVADEDRLMQFAAIHVGLSDGTTYVSFRGTDQTLLGWREDFMTSFQVTGAQSAAARYLAETMRPGMRYRVGGHSKGGNLAAYAAVMCPESQRDQLVRVYSDDGPGMATEVLPQGAHDVVGMLFERPGTPKTIVRSSAEGALQHDPLTWQTLAAGVDAADDLLPDCKTVNQTFSTWLASVDLEDRATFTQDLFDSLAAGGATTLDEVLSGGISGLQQVLSAMASTSERSRDVAAKLLQAAAGSVADATWVSAKASATTAIHHVGARAASAVSDLQRSQEEKEREGREHRLIPPEDTCG